ncbi:MAG: hypothetical protein ACKOAU_20085, partial [Pirellula sp.]
GFAPVINTIGSIIQKGKFDSLNWMFAGSLLLGILGAVTVLLNAPKAAPHGKPTGPTNPSEESKVPAIPDKATAVPNEASPIDSSKPSS